MTATENTDVTRLSAPEYIRANFHPSDLCFARIKTAF